MLKSLLWALLGLVLLPAPAALAAQEVAAVPRVSAFYTTWDDYYFYAAFQVHDTHVNGTNASPTSQPQQDDDIEVFFETDNAHAKVRTAQTYQMAVSVAGGSYFSVGTGSAIPKALPIYTWKYATTIDGTLNDNSDSDIGYTVEIAIPWQELGQPGPPRDGTVWGFNAISRDRESTARPADRFYSLSSLVQSGADVQTPSKWVQIVFDSTGTHGNTSRALVVSPHIILGRYPIINGIVSSGEWPSSSRLSFGLQPIVAPAPTAEQEPNTDINPFQNLPPAQQPPSAPATPEPPAPGPPPVGPPAHGAGKGPRFPASISLPGGGSIKVVPGGSEVPPMKPPTPSPETPTPYTPEPGANVNPLTPKYPRGYQPPAPAVSLTGSLTLTPDRPPSLICAVYRLDFTGDIRQAAVQNVWSPDGSTLIADQPINGAGPWFSGERPSWHRQQLSDLRRAGIETALIRCSEKDPYLSRELGALIEALDEMKQAHEDYPLIGIAYGDGSASIARIASQIPAEYRATLPIAGSTDRGWVVYNSTGANLQTTSSDPRTVTLPDTAAVVSPGRISRSAILSRRAGATYATQWQKAEANGAPDVVIESWNDFTDGSEIAASRQYGEKYADDTRLYVNTFNGDKEWHAKYLSEWVPRVILPHVLYQVPVRIENAGTLPWRAGEGYSLCARWYRDDRLFDDSAPRTPIGKDVMPGQSITLSLGVVALNSYGDDIEPGSYTLVIDLVQGNDRWFSYAHDAPLQVQVQVAAEHQPAPAAATFIGTGRLTAGAAGQTYQETVSVRNDSLDVWSSERLAYKIETTDPATGDYVVLNESAGVPLSSKPTFPGQIVDAVVPVKLVDSNGQSLKPGTYLLHWFVRPANGESISGSYDEPLRAVPADPGVDFILSDIPRNIDAGKTATAQLGILNLGPSTWPAAHTKVGYHWFYLDGAEAQWDGGIMTSLSRDIAPGMAEGDLTARFTAPRQPGRYVLEWDLQMDGSTWASAGALYKGMDILPVLVTVGGKGPDEAVDLSKYFNGIAVCGPDGTGADFDGEGSGLPIAMVPPDGAAEVDSNPLLQAKPGPPLYPSGYYAQQAGDGWASNHATPFLYPHLTQGQPDMIVCKGQTIALPGGASEIHLLCGASGGQPVSARFGLVTDRGTVSQSLSVADWGSEPAAPATAALLSPFRDSANGAQPKSAILGDYVLAAGSGDKISGITLPNNPHVKIMAITLVK